MKLIEQRLRSGLIRLCRSLSAMTRELEQMKKDRVLRNSIKNCELASLSASVTLNTSRLKASNRMSAGGTHEVVGLHISPDLGERIMLSADRTIIDEIFPEMIQAAIDIRSNVTWNQLDGRPLIRFPLNGYCKLNSVQVLTRLFNAGFSVEASTGGGVEGQQFSEYLLVRKNFSV